MDRPSGMQPARAPIRLTHEDYLGFPDDGRRHELIDGEHYMTPAPEIEVVKIYRRGEAGAFNRPTELRCEDRQVLESPVFPGFSLSLDELFAE